MKLRDPAEREAQKKRLRSKIDYERNKEGRKKTRRQVAAGGLIRHRAQKILPRSPRPKRSPTLGLINQNRRLLYLLQRQRQHSTTSSRSSSTLLSLLSPEDLSACLVCLCPPPVSIMTTTLQVNAGDLWHTQFSVRCVALASWASKNILATHS